MTPASQSSVTNADEPRSRTNLELILRWTARVWGLASTVVLLAFAFGGREHLQFSASEAIAFLLFPIGTIAGLVVAWRRELLGALITLCSFAAFNIWLFAVSERWPVNGYFLALIAPGFLHLINTLLIAHKRK